MASVSTVGKDRLRETLLCQPTHQFLCGGQGLLMFGVGGRDVLRLDGISVNQQPSTRPWQGSLVAPI
jgi:hypothetical protein